MTLRNIQAVAVIPPGIGELESIVPHGDQEVMLTDDSGHSSATKVDSRRI